MTMEDDRAHLDNRRGGPYLDQDHDGRRNRNGRGTLHHHAQRAMVGIAVERVHVHHLDHSQQRQQNQTQQGGRPKSLRLRAKIAA
jgi:hypothetical protein